MSEELDDEQIFRAANNVNIIKSTQRRPMSIMRYIGIRKSIIINNKCSKSDLLNVSTRKFDFPSKNEN